MPDDELQERLKAFTLEAHEFCLKASDRKIRTIIAFVIESPIGSATAASYTGAGMSLYESIGILEATSFSLKDEHCRHEPDEESDDNA